jgi:hypothetical protein
MSPELGAVDIPGEACVGRDSSVHNRLRQAHPRRVLRARWIDDGERADSYEKKEE